MIAYARTLGSQTESSLRKARMMPVLWEAAMRSYLVPHVLDFLVSVCND
jgi:hypothetical protein